LVLSLALQEHVPNLAGVSYYRPAPPAKAAMRIYRLHPFVEIAVFNAILLVLFAFGLQDEHLTIDQPHEKVGAIFAHHALIKIGNLEANMVILDPGGNGFAGIQMGGIGSLPGAVIDAEVDVRFFCACAGLARVPGTHLAGGTDGMIAVKDRLKALGVFLADGVQHVLDDTAHVEGDDEAAAQFVVIEVRRDNANTVGADELLDNANQLSQQHFSAAFPGVAPLVEHIRWSPEEFDFLW